MLESIAADIRAGSRTPAGGIEKAHQLLPIQKFMTRCGQRQCVARTGTC
jgi:hypothetical protein